MELLQSELTEVICCDQNTPDGISRFVNKEIFFQKGINIKMNKETFQIAFMPYAPIHEKFKSGQYDIWPFYKEAENKIVDQLVLEQLKKYFSRYVEFKLQRELKRHEEQPCQIVIISPSNINVGQDKLLENQISDIVSLVHIMAFSSIFEIGFTSNTSDPFQVHIQNFIKGEEGFSVWDKFYTNYNLFKVLKPLHINSFFSLSNPLNSVIH